MKKIFIIVCISLLNISCRQSNPNMNKTKVAENYINALNTSDYDAIIELFKDSIRMKELVYSSVFSKDDYYQLFQWDSTFSPVYKIIEIKEEDDAVRMTVSKECPRILFLNQEPIVTNEIVEFEDGKIHSIEITKYVVFNEKEWEFQRTKLVEWTEQHSPERNDFLYDQTKEGAIKYLEVIKRYTSGQ
ncbi:MAG: hypothetical protein AAF717_07960 [Bacteroidota bacterium]